MSGIKTPKLLELCIEKDSRCLRTSNAEFSAKQKNFLANIRRSIYDEDTYASDDSLVYIDDDDENDADFELRPSSSKKASGKRTVAEIARDMFCWFCHKDRSTKVLCTTCTRVYHYQCAKVTPMNVDEKYRCYECVELDVAKKHEAGQFNRMLKYVLNKIIESVQSKQKFQNLIRKEEYPKHLTYAIDLNEIVRNVNAKKYTSGKAFVLDVAWMAHIYSAYFPGRKAAIEDVRHLLKVCKDEMFNIETCSECFVKSSSKTKDDWFTKVCAKPHLLIWAKLSGYPYWPAKAMGAYDDVLNVQFFGEHERAFVPAKDCFLYSREDPNPVQPKTFRQQNFLNCVAEATEYIKNISAKFGQFYYAEFKTPLDPNMLEKYVLETIAGYGSNHPDIIHASQGLNTNSTSNSITTSRSAITTTTTSNMAITTDTVSLTNTVTSASTVTSANMVTASTAKPIRITCGFTSSKSTLGERNKIATSTPKVIDVAVTSREAKFINKKRKMVEEAQASYYKKKYVKILENPGAIVLDRIDLTESPLSRYRITGDNEISAYVETAATHSNDELANIITAPEQGTVSPYLNSSNAMSPFPTFNDKKGNRRTTTSSFYTPKSIPLVSTVTHPSYRRITSSSLLSAINKSNGSMASTSQSIPNAILPTASDTVVGLNPLPTTSAHVPNDLNPVDVEADEINQENRILEMEQRLWGMFRAANEKSKSLQNDWDAIAEYAEEIKKLKMSADRTKADHNPQCVNCGKNARLFCTWSTGYCDLPCREQYRAKHGDFHATNRKRNGSNNSPA